MHVVTVTTLISIPGFLVVVLPAVILSAAVVTSGHLALQPTAKHIYTLIITVSITTYLNRLFLLGHLIS